MTDPTPEKLDELVARMVKITGYKYASRDQGLLFCDLGTISLGDVADLCAAITALRAREALIEAAAIERAAAACDAIAVQAKEYNIPQMAGGAIGCRNDIRAIITPGARTLLDQRIAEAEQAGYRRGAMDAKPHFGHPITLQQAARMMLHSHTVQTMVAAGRPLDLVATLTAMSQGDA